MKIQEQARHAAVNMASSAARCRPVRPWIFHGDVTISGDIIGIYPLVNKQLDPENHQLLEETNLPTPFSNARVYVNLPEGNRNYKWYRIEITYDNRDVLFQRIISGKFFHTTLWKPWPIDFVEFYKQNVMFHSYDKLLTWGEPSKHWDFNGENACIQLIRPSKMSFKKCNMIVPAGNEDFSMVDLHLGE